MDHRVSKDMISSGMTPSGKKSQSDLGKTQYGSAPSPSRLMDAYQSMYDKKEEVINEMKLGDVSGSKDFASRNIKGAKGASNPPTPEKTGRSQEEIKKSVDQSIQKGQERAEKREKLKGIMSKYGESVDLLAAYRAVYEHHQKDENGNTIPHDDVKEGKLNPGLQAFLDKKKGKKGDKEDKKKAKKGKGGKPDFLDLDKDGDKKEPMKKASKEMKEGAGLYANIHAKRKRGGKMRKKGAKGAPSSQDFANASRTAKEDFDKYDLVYNHFIEEGFSEEETYERMSNLTEEQIDEFVGLALGAGKMLLGKIGATAAAGKVAAGAATKGALAAKSAKIASAAGTAGKTAATTTQAAKPLTGIAKQSFTAPSVTPPKPMVNAPTQSKVTTSGGKTAPGTDLKNLKDKNKNLLTRAKDSFNDMSTLEKVYTAQGVASLVPSGGSSQGANKISKTRQISADPNKKPIAASADLFDIVKGQLLDEGLSEEEIRNIMLELTPEEIMSEMAVNPNIAAMDAKNKADMIARAQANKVPDKVREASRRQMKAGTPREDKNNPYTTQDKKTIIDYNKNK